MSSVNIKDLVQLKLQKKILQAKLHKIDDDSHKLNEILNFKKSHATSSLFKSQPIDSRVLIGDKILSEVRLGHSSVKAIRKPLPKPTAEIEPSPIPLGGNLERIRHQHLCRTVGKKIVRHRQNEGKAKAKLKKTNQAMKCIPLKIPPSFFPHRYARGELPCSIEHGTKGLYLSWVCPLENLDYDYYLPLFFDGLQCTDHTLIFLSTQGIEDMLYASQGDPQRVLPTIPKLVKPLRNALSLFNKDVLLRVLKALRQLIQSNPEIGPTLTPYYKQFLAPMKVFLDCNKNTGDEMDYGQRNNEDIGESVRNTLELMERLGSDDALKAIKFAIPPYQSYTEGNKPVLHGQSTSK